MSDRTSQPFRLPRPQSLPSAETSLGEAVQFIRGLESTVLEHFRQRWGDDFPVHAQARWGSCVHAFRSGEAGSWPPEDLLLVLTYDYVLGPYLGVPEPHKLDFWRWLLDGIRRGLSGASNERSR